MRAPRPVSAAGTPSLPRALLAALALLWAAGHAARAQSFDSQSPPAQPSGPRPAAAPSPDLGFSSPAHFAQRDGAALYAAICQGCHMPDGRGASGAAAYPALAANPRLEAAAYPVHVVANGLRSMPGFANQLDDAQVAAVVNFVRTEFAGHRDAPATPEEVRAARP